MNHCLDDQRAVTISAERFWQALVATGLLTKDEIGKLLTLFPAAKRSPANVGRELIRTRRLTPYQVAMLLQDHGSRLVLNSYVIQERIGAGGMGAVFKAYHRHMKRVVALKVLPADLTHSPGAVQRFQREVEAAAQLSHPNIVAAYDADEIEDTHFLVMEYVAGSDLSRLIRKNGPLPVPQAIDCIVQAARGLEHAHARGIIHRDIKPSNLLLDNQGTLKILDMGLARLTEGQNQATARTELTRTGIVMGTCEFMAPEQALNSHAADPRSDIYSLGCTLYYLIAGRAPYRGANAMETLLAHRERSIPQLSKDRAGVCRALDTICRRMLAKAPCQRYQSMREVIMALEALGRPQSSPWIKPTKRLAVVGVVMLAAVLVTFSWFRRGSDGRPNNTSASSVAMISQPKDTPRATSTVASRLQPPDQPMSRKDELAKATPLQQVTAALTRLRELNPGFDGQGTYQLEHGAVVSLTFHTDQVEDISPVSELHSLLKLCCSGSGENRGKLRNLQPLRGLRLADFICSFNPRLDDLSPLQGMRLESLDCVNTAVTNISVLADMPLTLVHCSETPVRDLTPLRGTPLRRLRFDARPDQDWNFLRSMKTLRNINSLDPAEFFRSNDAK